MNRLDGRYSYQITCLVVSKSQIQYKHSLLMYLSVHMVLLKKTHRVNMYHMVISFFFLL